MIVSFSSSWSDAVDFAGRMKLVQFDCQSHNTSKIGIPVVYLWSTRIYANVVYVYMSRFAADWVLNILNATMFDFYVKFVG